MPLSEKELLFIERMALTGDIVAAVIEAGLDEDSPLPAHIIGQKMLRRHDINDALVASRRVREKMEVVTIGAGLTREAQLAKLESLYREAREKGKHSDAIKAVETQSKLMGHLVDKQEIIIGRKQPADMTVDELRQEMAMLIESEKKRTAPMMIDVTPNKEPENG